MECSLLVSGHSNDRYVPPYQNVVKLHESLGMKPGYKTTKPTKGNDNES